MPGGRKERGENHIERDKNGGRRKKESRRE
jgi:hypothetical protein